MEERRLRARASFYVIFYVERLDLRGNNERGKRKPSKNEATRGAWVA